MTKCKQLRKIYGGNWIYDRRLKRWLCDDGRRYVHATASIDLDGEFYWAGIYHMYGDGAGKLVLFNDWKLK